ncbi:class I SAM-dependent DNA methyltransferase [Agrobacterium sp. S2]|nr:class I SAM-dependent DNA methyltransferase [Agrobacterium sp. S2]
MTPDNFLKKWRNVELKERSASQSHFNDLCALLGLPDPVSADTKGEWFTFEKGASKTGGGNGWADVWRRECFGWEYKGRHTNLDKAYAQLLQYSVALENPPLLIVSDMHRIVIRTNWTNSVQETHEIALDDLIDGAVRDRLKAAFVNPEQFKPAKSRQQLTEETARDFVAIAQRLRERGHEAHRVAHFVNQLVFCMFAEDVGLLPDYLFTKMLTASHARPERFESNAAKLFGAMAEGGDIDFTPIDWFNGGLFADKNVLPVSSEDIAQLLSAARRDWSQIDPSILGTLFERGLDPAKRSQLGAHYTDRDKIMMIVRPVIIEPLEAEWADALARITALVVNAPRQTAEKLLRGAELGKRTRALTEAQAIHAAFIERLANFRVLDPACGSGNFLYVSLKALKDIEHRANLDAEALGLLRGFPRTGPENVLGIELNPYAAELARVSVWIGEIQWMRRNGFDAAKNPILRPLETIECRDAVLNGDGTQAEWPTAEVVVGNPPFLGNKKMIGELGEDYVRALRKAWAEVPGGVDLVCYWFAKAWAMMVRGRLERAGLVATQAIRRGTNRKVLNGAAGLDGIFNAWSDEEWTVDGADVRVSLVCFEPQKRHHAALDGTQVGGIGSDLKPKLIEAEPVALNENKGVAGQGTISGGPFEVAPAVARELLTAPINPNGEMNAEVLRPWRNGDDLTDRPSDWWIIDFGEREQSEAAFFEKPYALLEAAWDAEQRRRAALGEKALRAGEPKTAARWWIMQRRRTKLLSKIMVQKRYLATPRVSKHRFFVWLDPKVIPDTRLVVFRREDETFMGIVHSRIHEVWSLRLGGKHGVGNDPEYVHTSTFETFPFPEGLTPDISAAAYADDPRAQAIATAAARLNEPRKLASPRGSCCARARSRARLSRSHPAEERGGGEGTQEAHAYQSLQRPPAMASEHACGA